jgi:hypothetical protein
MEQHNPFNPEKTSMLKMVEGQKFHKLEKEDRPKVQYFISMLLRGNMNASQVVKEGDKYFSHYQVLEDTSKKENIILSIEADRFILKYVFHDSDHGMAIEPEFNRENNTTEEINVITDKNLEKYTVFDFGEAFEPFDLDSEEDINILQGAGPVKFNYKMQSLIEFYGKANKSEDDVKLAKLLLEKTNSFLTGNFKDNTFFNNVLAKSELDLCSSDIQKYFDFLKINDNDKNYRANIMFEDIKLRLKTIQQAAVKYLIEKNKNK